jgi:hypothetical protein
MFSFLSLLHLLHKIFIGYLAYFVPNQSVSHIFDEIIQLVDITKFFIVLNLDYVTIEFSGC